LRAIKTKHNSQRVTIVGTVGYNIASYWDLCFKALQFPKPKTNGRQIWPPPRAAKCPATLLCHINSVVFVFSVHSYVKNSESFGLLQ